MRHTTTTNLASLRAAAERLLSGNPIRSNGALTLATLAVEAGLQRPYLYRTPYDAVVREFETAVAGLSKSQREALRADEATPGSDAPGREAKAVIKELKEELAALKVENEALLSQVSYLDLQNAELESRVAAQVTSIHGRRK